MAIRDYLGQTAQVWRKADGAADRYGTPTGEWSQVGTCQGRMELREGKEIKDGVEIVTTQHVWFMEPALVALDPAEGEEAVEPGALRETDRLIVDGETYEIRVIAPRRGRLATVHHLSVTLGRLR
jgi:hypothetical protein